MNTKAWIISCLLLLLFPSDQLQAQVVSQVAYSASGGFYYSPFSLTLLADEPTAAIRYTLDGSAPTAGGMVYTSGISINTTAVVRAVAYTPTDTTEIFTQSYIFIDDVVNQPDAVPGYPSEMSFDPSIKNDAAYSALLGDALLQIPSLSLVLDPADFDAVHESAVERIVSVELLHPSGEEGFQVYAGVKRVGGSSFNSPKRNLRLSFRSEYGASKLNYPLFGPEATDKIDQIALRPGFHGCINRGEGNDLADQVVRNYQINTQKDGIGIQGVFMHLYINGKYWGVYNPSERGNDAFGEAYYGGEKDNWDAIKRKEVLDGNITAWNTLNDMADNLDMSNAQNFEAAKEYVEMEQFIDYVLITNYAPHADNHTSGKNSYVIRDRTKTDGFRFYIWDTEPALGHNWTWGVSEVGPRPYANIYNSLLDNSDYRTLIGDRMQCHCFDEGALTPAKAIAEYEAVFSATNLAFLAEAARWGEAANYEEFLSTRDRIVNDYLPTRTTITVDRYRNANYYPSIDAVTFSQNGGIIPPNFSLSLTNPNNNGTLYYTLDGTDPRASGGAVAATAQVYSGSLTLNGVVTVRARVKNGATWSAMCPKTFFGPQDLSGLVINEIQYNPTVACGNEVEFLELYNNGNTTLNLTDCYFEAGIDYVFPEGSLLAPSSFLVMTNDEGLFSAYYGFEADAQYGGKLSGGGELIALVNPFGELIDTLLYDDKFPWPAAADGAGPSLELRDPDLDNAQFQNWYASTVACGTPSAPNSDPCSLDPAALVINEINYKSLATFESADWIELHNPTAAVVDLANWQLQDEQNGFSIPSGTQIPAAGYLVLVSNDTLFTIVHPEVTNYVGNLEFGFSSGGEALQLLSPEGCLVDAVTYLSVAPWPTVAAGDGPSLSLLDSASDNALAASWVPSYRATGTPGQANAGSCTSATVVFNEINYNSPATQNAGDWLELFNKGSSTVDLSAWQLHDATGVYTFSAGKSVAADAYLVMTGSTALFTEYYPTVQNYQGGLGLGLSNGGEELRLFDANRCLVDFVPYDDKAPWPLEADGGGPSLSLLDAAADNALAENWEASSANGTPGRENVACPLADFKLPQADACVSVPLTLLVENEQLGANYSWLFEQGNPAQTTGLSATSEWENAGSYSISLALAYFECADTLTQVLTVENCNTPPVALADNYTVDEDNLLNDNVLVNDSDPDNDQLLLNETPIVAPANGSLTLESDGSFGYMPTNNFNGNDSFRYQVCDDGSPVICAEATVFISISAQNDAPSLVTDNATTAEDQSLNVDILANDFDVDGNLDVSTLQLNTVLAASQGTISLNTDGSLTFVPAANYSGTVDLIEYSICDDGTPLPALCATANLTIIVTSQNDAPDAVDDTYTTNEDEAVLGNILDNDTDLDGNALIVATTPLVAPIYGTLSLQADGAMEYLPNENYFGDDSFSYELCDDGEPQLCTQANVFIQVTPINDFPNAILDKIVTEEEIPVNINILGNDFDIDGDLDSASLFLINFPPNFEGNVLLNADRSITFVPAVDFYGPVSIFYYNICDTGTPMPVSCAEGAVTITVTNVNDAPIARPDSLTTIENATVYGSVLENDADKENDALEVMEDLVTTAPNGAVLMEKTGNFNYTPTIGFSGLDSFVYMVCDKGTPVECSTATVYISVLPCPDALIELPVQACASSPVLIAAVDQGSGAAYAWDFGSDASPLTSTAASNLVNYASAGVKTIRLIVTKNGCTVEETVSLNVSQAAYAIAGTAASLCPGEATILGGNPTGPAGASFLWSPAAGLNNTSASNPIAYPDTTTTYTVRVTYGNCTISDEVRVEVKDLPFAEAGPDQATCGESLQIGGQAAGPPGASYSWYPTTGLDDPTAANPQVDTPNSKTYTLTVTLNGCTATDEVYIERKYPPAVDAGMDQMICYDPDDLGAILGGPFNLPNSQYKWSPNAYLSHPFEGNTYANPPETTTYTVTASKDGCSDTAAVTVFVEICNEAPVALLDQDTTYIDSPLIGQVLDNDSDPDGPTADLTVNMVISTFNGQLDLMTDGSYAYTPDPGYLGYDDFVYEVCDKGVPSLCARAKVTIWVATPCVELAISAFLEGGYDANTGRMSTILNTELGVLPGQIPGNPVMPATPLGQPYHQAPWYYSGGEGMAYDSIPYDTEAVDWLLLSLRTTVADSTEVLQVAGLLMADGRMTFEQPCFDLEHSGPFYVVVEHRSHMAVMSPMPIIVEAGRLYYDFSTSDSFNAGGIGQKEIQGKWMLYAGNGVQEGDGNGYDISGEDKVLFSEQNGNFDAYLPADYNLDGDINGKDKILWSRNNGVFSSIPH